MGTNFTYLINFTLVLFVNVSALSVIYKV